MRICIIIMSCFFLNMVYSQPGFKVKHFIPNALTNNSKAIFESSPGNYIAAGITLDTVNGEQINHLCIMGLGSNGQMLWTKKYGNNKWIYLDNNFINRSFYKQGAFVYHTCCALDSIGNYNGVLLKFDLNGDTVWQKIYRDPILHDLVPQMVTGSVDGGFLITGYHITNNPCLLLKTDIDGNELWRKKIGNPNVLDGKAIVQDTLSKKIIIGGYKLVNSQIRDNILILDSLGNFPLQFNYCKNPGGIISDMIQTSDKKIVAIGYQYYPQTIGGDNLMMPFAVKIDLNIPSSPIWKIDTFDKLALYNGFSCLKELPNRNFLLGGYIDTLHGTLNSSNSATPNILIRLTVIDSGGSIKGNRYYDYKTNTPSDFNFLGLKSLELCKDGSWLSAIKLSNFSANPFLFVKYDSNGCDSTAAHCATLNLVGIQKENSPDIGISLYPNPVKDLLIIEIETNRLSELFLNDISGRELKHVYLSSNSKIDLNDLSSGMYLVTITQNKKVVYKTKIIKEN